MESTTIQHVIQQLKTKAIQTQRKQTQLKCRTFLRKLGYKARSQKLVTTVERHVKQQGLQFILPKGMASWKDIDPDGTLIFALAEDVAQVEKPKQALLCDGQRRTYPLYAFQQEAIETIERAYQQMSRMRGLLVLPTGGGKTTTAVEWVMPHLLKGTRVLWLAHRHELLEQALRTFQRTARYAKHAPISYRLISGKHQSIKGLTTEQLVIASKDSVYNQRALLTWCAHQHIIVIVDEAHHAAARTYRELLLHIRKASANCTVLGLTATPYRTSEDEAGSLKQVFPQDILFKRDLKTLISAGMLAEPIFRDLKTDVVIEETIDAKQIESLDQLPAPIAKQLATHQQRNHVIIDAYMRERKTYQKTIVFAINQTHALVLAELFERRGVKCGVVISSQPKAQQQTIEKFRAGALEVLINVNILTEGADFPDVQTVFLARPTTSSILMTQMIGRALRGKAAGGTSKAYVVSFIDEWATHIAWAQSQRLVEGPDLFNEAVCHQREATTALISSQLIANIAHDLDKAIDPERLTHVTFSESVPIGVYAFAYAMPQREERVEVLVYAHLREDYAKMRERLPQVCAQYPLTDYPEHRVVRAIAQTLMHECFSGNYQAPSVELQDIVDLVRYYAQYETMPTLLYFTERQDVDITRIAQHILTQDLSQRAKTNYLNDYWQTHRFAQIYFNYNEYYFRKCVDHELLRMELAPHQLADMSLTVWKKEQPSLYRRILRDLFRRAKVSGGYRCMRTGQICAQKSDFAIRYRVPLSKGGQTTLDNLMLVKK